MLKWNQSHLLQLISELFFIWNFLPLVYLNYDVTHSSHYHIKVVAIAAVNYKWFIVTSNALLQLSETHTL